LRKELKNVFRSSKSRLRSKFQNEDQDEDQDKDEDEDEQHVEEDQDQDDDNGFQKFLLDWLKIQQENDERFPPDINKEEKVWNSEDYTSFLKGIVTMEDS